MADMLVKLYDLPELSTELQDLKAQGVSIKKAIAPDKTRVVNYVKENFNQSWADECDCAFSNHPVSCYIATKDHEIIGFACFDSTTKNFFGPTGISADQRGLGIGKVLLLKCLHSMKEQGYGYAIIGGVGSARGFYEKAVNATTIENSVPGVYQQMIHRD